MSRAAVFLMLAVMMCSVSVRAETEPNGYQTIAPNAYSMHDALPEHQELYRVFLVDAYLEHGTRSEAWDDLAIKFLEHATIRWTYGDWLHPNYTLAALRKAEVDYGSFDELIAGLQKAKCTDPLINYLIASYYCAFERGGQMPLSRAHPDSRRREKGSELMAKNYEAFRKSDYHGWFKFLCVSEMLSEWGSWSWLSLIKNDRAKAEYNDRPGHVTPYMLELLELAGKQSSFTKKDFLVRTVADRIRRIADICNTREEVLDFLKPMAALETLEDDDEWVYRMASGAYHVEMAKAYAKRGYQQPFKPEHRREYDQHMAKASEHLALAWRIEPTQFVAAQIIRLGTKGHGPAKDNLQTWFDRGLAIQFDADTLWDSMRHSREPRNGGSLDALKKLAIEAVNTGRFDTPVPSFGRKILRDIEFVWGVEFWGEPAVHAAMDRLSMGLLNSTIPYEESREWFWLYRAALMYKCGDLTQARSALDEVGAIEGEVAEDAKHAFKLLFLRYASTVGEIYARTSPRADRLERARKYMDGREWQQAHEILSNIVEQADEFKPLERAYYETLLGSAALELELEKGQWIELPFTEETVSDWEQVGGAWSVDGKGGLLGKPVIPKDSPHKFDFLAVYRYPLRDGWELSCDMEVVTLGHRSIGSVGVVSDYDLRIDGQGHWIFPGKDYADFWAELSGERDWPSQLHKKDVIKHKGVNQMQVKRFASGQLEVIVNGVAATAPLGNRRRDGKARYFGLSTLTHDSREGEILSLPKDFKKIRTRYSNLKIRKLPSQ